MTVTDEMVEKALAILPPGIMRVPMRAALEAVAPLLIAQGMREAAEIAKETISPSSHLIAYDILARAQELDPHA